MPRASCEVCAWACETDDETDRYELNRAMIDHHVYTGHAPIESTDAGDLRLYESGETGDGAGETVDGRGAGETVGEREADEPAATGATNENGSPTAVVDDWTPVEPPSVDRGPWRGTGADRP